MNSLGELFIQLAFEGDTKGAEEFRNSLKEVENSAQLMIKTMQDLTKTVQKLVEVELSKLTETTDNATASTENNTSAVDENTQTIVENTETTQENTQVVDENTQTIVENTETTQENTQAVDENTQADKKNAKTKKENSNNIKKVIKGLRNYALAISGAIYAIHRLTDSLLKENQQWLNLTRTSDVALETFQKWGSIGKTLGISNAAEQIKDLNDRLFEMRLTGQGARGFILAGINPTNAEDVMEQLRNRVTGLDDTSASYILRQIGLDPSMLHILRLSREEFASINAELSKYRLTNRQRSDLQMFNLQIQIAAQRLQYLKQKALLAIMPLWTKFMQSLSRVTEGVSKFVQIIISAIRIAPFFQKAILGIATALLAISAHPIMAALTALYLIIDDIVGYFQGKKSFFGGVLYVFDEIKNKINFETPQWIKDLVYLVQNIDNIAGAVRDIKNGNVEVSIKDVLVKLALGSTLGPAAIPAALTSSAARAISNFVNNNYIEQNNYINTNETAREVGLGLNQVQAAFAR